MKLRNFHNFKIHRELWHRWGSKLTLIIFANAKRNWNATSVFAHGIAIGYFTFIKYFYAQNWTKLRLQKGECNPHKFNMLWWKFITIRNDIWVLISLHYLYVYLTAVRLAVWDVLFGKVPLLNIRKAFRQMLYAEVEGYCWYWYWC